MNSITDQIKNKLSGFHRKLKLENLLIGILWISIISISMFFIFSLFELSFYFSPKVRSVLFITWFITTIGLIIYLLVLKILLTKPDFISLASRTGKFYKNLNNDEIVNVLQLASIDSNSYSSNLIFAAGDNTLRKILNLNFSDQVNFSSVKTLSKKLLPIIITILILFIFIAPLQYASYRIINFNKTFLPPQKFYLNVVPGNYEITKGEKLLIKVYVTGIEPQNIFLNIKESGSTSYSKVKLLKDSTFYKYVLSSVNSDFSYFASSEDIRTEDYKITVLNFPVISKFNLQIVPPSYSNLPGSNLQDDGNVTSLKGTLLKFNIESTQKLKSARLVFSDSTFYQLKVSENNANGNYSLLKNNEYHIEVTDVHNNTNQYPVSYQLTSLEDAFPLIEVIEPKGTTDLNIDNRLKLLSSIQDDYGFSKLMVHYKIKGRDNDSSFKSFNLNLNSEIEQLVEYIWNMTKLDLGGNESVMFLLELFDNDYISGPKSVKTSMFEVRVPSLDELLAKTEKQNSKVEKQFEELAKQAGDLDKKMEKLDQELKQDKKDLTWQEKEKIEKTANEFSEIQKKAEEVSKELKSLKDDLQQNNLLSKETLEKYMQLQELLDELTSDEMKKALEKLQDQLQQMNRKQAQESLKDMAINEEAFKKSIERTMNLLKMIQIEQKFDEVVKRSEKALNDQNQVQKETSKNNLNDNQKKDALKDAQENISEQIKKLEQEVEKLKEKMSDVKNLPKDEMQKMLEEFKKENNDKLSEESANEINKGNEQQAQQAQKQVSNNLSKMNKSLKQMQSSMSQNNKMQTFKEMAKTLDNILSLSKQQEELSNSSKQLEYGSQEYNQNAIKQEKLEQSLDKILQQMNKTSQKTFAITPEMGKALGDAKKSMNNSIASLQQMNNSNAAMNQKNAMKSLNEAAQQMQSNMQSMMQGGQGGGMMSLMEQLQKMSGEQMSLNNMTQQLSQQGKLSPQEQAQLQRLAQQQELIKKSIEQLNKEAKLQGESKKLPGNLEDIAKQMEEVVANMGNRKVDDNLVQKQEKILSKMIDMQKSLNEKDFEEERESYTAQNNNKQSPNQLKLNKNTSNFLFKDQLDRASKEGYKKDYEEIIKNYFNLLQKN